MGLGAWGGGITASIVLGALALTACSSAVPYGSSDDNVVGGAKKREPTKRSSTSGPDADGAGFAVTKVDPPSVKLGSVPSGLTVTVTGTGFDSVSKVAIAGRVVETQFGSATSLTATVPATHLTAVGGLPVTVIGKSARSNELNLMVYDASSALTSILPSSIPARVGGASANANLSLTVSGTGFEAGSVVVFNGADVPTTVASPSSLVASVTSDLLTYPGQVNVSVRGAATLSAPIIFTITNGGSSSSSSSSSSGSSGFCSNGVSCFDLDLARFECTSFGGTVVQCEDDGCVYNGCF